MRRRINVPTLYALGPAIVGPVAAIAWQEGHSAVAGLLGLAFVGLLAGGVRKLRVYWR